MKVVSIAALAAATIGLTASAASAATFITKSATSPGGNATDPGDSGYVNILSFGTTGDSYSTAPGVSVTFAGDSGVFSSANTDSTARPSGLIGDWGAAKIGGDVTIDLASYLSSHPGTDWVSFYWGSVDPGNSVSLLNASGQVLETITGTQVSPATGNQSSPATNLRVALDAGAYPGFVELQFATGSAPFEFGDVSVGDGSATLGDPPNAGIVPEPASWALALVGLGLVGAAMRARPALART